MNLARAVIAVGVCLLAIGLRGRAVYAGSVEETIQAAGNCESETERLSMLRSLETRTDLDPTLREELKKLIPIVQDWADGKTTHVSSPGRAAENGYLCWFIDGKLIRPAVEGGEVYPPEPAAGSPLHPLWAYYRARLLLWRPIQSSPLLRVSTTRDLYYGEARKLLQEASQAFPENRVIGMYLGKPIPWSAPNQPDPSAPAWANLQREGLERLSEIVHWWIRERQLPDGQFGGGWGDDVEMWRWWAPVLVAFEDPEMIESQVRISNGIFAQPHLRSGFTNRVSDVEHTNEDTTDTILPMMHLTPDAPLWQGRALRLSELMRDRWTGRNERGFLQFKSIYFSDEKVDESPRRAFDTVYHTSIIQPTLLYWQRTRDPELTTLFGEWLKVWIDATLREENGKPAKVLPSTISWPAGKVGVIADGNSWWQPFSMSHNDLLYNWPSVGRQMTSTMLLAWHITGDDQYFRPLRAMVEFVREHRNASENPEPGSHPWVARHMQSILSETLSKYRFLTNDPQYDDILRAGATAYTKFRLDGNVQQLEKGLLRNAEAFRSNWEGYTSEMRWTDRVLLFSRHYLQYLPEAAPPSPDVELLYASATGDPGQPTFFPLNAVRWRTPPTDIAALVTRTTRTDFEADLYHFGEAPRAFEAEFLLLQPGKYQLTVSSAEGQPESSPQFKQTFTVSGPRVVVPLEIPSRRLSRIKVAPLTE
ncbi:hypothetical protein [Planctomicrobium sp. SH664]|uniref:hypothetical protein n=1 Tax=Planctomicrobium sp. SH664 TaxID=3448125 RepID=UPI003F5AE98C